MNDFLRRCFMNHIKEGATFGSNLSAVFMIIEPKAQNCGQTHVECQTFENPENRDKGVAGTFGWTECCTYLASLKHSCTTKLTCSFSLPGSCV